MSIKVELKRLTKLYKNFFIFFITTTLYVVLPVVCFSYDGRKKMRDVIKRPGRKIAAEKRRIAKEILQEFIEDGDFYYLPHDVQEALLVIAPDLKERRIFSFKNKEALHEVC